MDNLSETRKHISLTGSGAGRKGRGVGDGGGGWGRVGGEVGGGGPHYPKRNCTGNWISHNCLASNSLGGLCPS